MLLADNDWLERQLTALFERILQQTAQYSAAILQG
jgi:hypothetical protein